MSASSSVSSAVSRRRFIYTSTISAVAVTLLPGCASPRHFKSPGEKLNVGIIGVGGKGESDADGLAGENIVAICDVDENTLNKAAQKYPNAKRYRDYRRMLDQQKDLDAVTVSTPDHHHFPASMMAMQLGKHVYCQKPLTHTIWEARMMAKTARRYKVATQMGNQGHSSDSVRSFCELIWAGAIGPVREVHCWSNRPIWPQGLERPREAAPVPANLDWDLWIGPAPMRPYAINAEEKKPAYHPFAWRGFWDFGTGALGDMACHIMDAAFWSLHLTNPTSVEAESSAVNQETAPKSAMITYQFPARKKMVPVKLVWYDGGRKPANELMGVTDAKKIPDNGSLFVGDKGKMTIETYGGKPTLLPGSTNQELVTPPKTLRRVGGHYKEWISACKGGEAASSNFDYAGPFTEMVLLGNLAVRTGKKILWDGSAMKAKNVPEAAQYIRKEYRQGWKV